MLSKVFIIFHLIKSDVKVKYKIDQLTKIDCENPCLYTVANDYAKIDKEILEDFEKEYIETKKSLEDKAKSTLIAITISTTLILGITNLLKDIIKYNIALGGIFVLLSALCIGYMIGNCEM